MADDGASPLGPLGLRGDGPSVLLRGLLCRPGLHRPGHGGAPRPVARRGRADVGPMAPMAGRDGRLPGTSLDSLPTASATGPVLSGPGAVQRDHRQHGRPARRGDLRGVHSHLLGRLVRGRPLRRRLGRPRPDDLSGPDPVGSDAPQPSVLGRPSGPLGVGRRRGRLDMAPGADGAADAVRSPCLEPPPGGPGSVGPGPDGPAGVGPVRPLRAHGDGLERGNRASIPRGPGKSPEGVWAFGSPAGLGGHRPPAPASGPSGGAAGLEGARSCRDSAGGDGRRTPGLGDGAPVVSELPCHDASR